MCVKMAAFGVHFGTCSACLAVYKDGKTDVVANDLGDRVTPCVVAFTEHEATVGAAAKQGIIRNAPNTVSHVKRLLGRAFNDPVSQDYIASSPVKVLNQDGEPVFEVEYKEKKQKFSPVKIAEMIYRKMLETAQSHGGSGIQDAVLAVPSDFTAEQRNAVSDAAVKAGFNVLRVISECSAAALAYDLGQLEHHEEYKLLVYRLGGTSHDATVLQVQNGMYRVMASCTDHSFGADRFTEILQKHLAAEFQRMYRCNPLENKRSAAKLLLNAERCKHTLSNLSNAECAADSLYDGIDFHCAVSRARFENQCTGVLSQCTQLIQQALTEAGCPKEDVKKVVVCGGGAKMPLVQRTISSFLSSSEMMSSNSISEDEVIATGAAKEAAILVGKDGNQLLEVEKNSSVRCTTKAICIKVKGSSGDQLEVVLPAGSLIPSRQQHAATLADGQTSFVMEVFESAAGDSSLSAAQKLAKIVMRDLSPESTIKSHFHLKREGDLHITCHDAESGRQESISIPVADVPNHS